MKEVKMTKRINIQAKSSRTWWKRTVPMFLALHFSLLNSSAQIGTWKNYLSYQNIQQISAAGNDIFVRASNAVYLYNTNDQSITTFDKVNGLNDTYITHIAWNKQAKRLIAVYQNSNIDLIETNGNVTNVSAIYSKTMTEDKTINNVFIFGKYAYLSTGFGIVKLNMQNAEISETYNLGRSIFAVDVRGNDIWASTQVSNKTALTASLSDNLIDPSNWKLTSNLPDNAFNTDNTDWEKYYDIIATLTLDGPKYNYFYESKFYNNRLYTTGGYFLSGMPDNSYPGSVQVLDGNDWTIYEDQLDTITGYQYVDNNCIDIDPTDENHVAVGGRCGLYEFQNGKLLKYHNRENSLLKGAIDRGKELGNNYVLVHSIQYDKSGNLWVLNSQSLENNLLELKKDGTWISHRNSLLEDNDKISLIGLRNMFFDSNGLLWFVNTNWQDPSLFCYDKDNDVLLKYSDFTNQDGTIYKPTQIYCAAEDKEGNIWVGTNLGPFLINKSDIGKESIIFNQVKVPRNDGTNYADYLLNGVSISHIAIDGANHKWFGTNGAGVFQIGADNLTQIANFREEDTSLLSDNILTISSNNKTGEVFFLTDRGLCSYLSNTTEASAEIEKDNVYAYPNPVEPGYTGLISIVGLSYDADVKIVSPNGALIAEGRSNGGTFTWDGNDRNGDRVASGIYMAVIATSDGKKGTVCKIAIVN